MLSYFAFGTEVTLTATAAVGSRFTGWSGSGAVAAGCTTASTCTVTMSADRTVVATFIQTFTLTVSTSGGGSSTVTSGDGYISCGATCTKAYDAASPATSVVLTANPATGYRLVS